MRVTIKDIAKLADVSVTTASMALNNKKGVNEETRLKVLNISKELDYHPNKNARSLKTYKTLTIGLIVPEITNPYFASIVECIRKEFENLGYTLLFGVSGDEIKNEQKYVFEFIERNVEGIIIVPTNAVIADLSHLYYLKRIKMPFIFLATKYEGIPANCVMTDLYNGSYLITKHLLENGHEKIFMITVDRRLLTSNMRLNGYMDAFRDMKKKYKDEWIYETLPDFEHGYEASQKIIQKKPDAIITINDILAFGVLKFLKDIKIKVPEEISVAGYDDIIFASISETPLTTVRQPIESICAKAVELILKEIRCEELTSEIYYFKPELKIRDSTRQ
ncbi:MAG TPA: hypothetical protein DDW65_08945 [Firmicutes bacterium]|nr:hypothetical protein [Bacillota bacterium]